MENNFQWTKKLIDEFFDNLPEGATRDIIERMEQFKSSKTRKEWEVVAFDRHGEIYKLIEDWRNNGNWTQPIFEGKFGTISLDFGFEQKQDYSIHSIRRLSDDWIVSVRDKVKSSISGRIGTIKSFDATGHILFEDITGLDHVTTIEKLPVPVLVTANGVPIYEDETFFVVGKDCELSERRAGDASPRFIREGDITFSTREAAELFVFESRPSLSIRDLKTVIAWNVSGIDFDAIIEKATELIKQKNK